MRNHEKSLGPSFKKVVYCTVPGSVSLIQDTIYDLKKIIPDVIVYEGVFDANLLQDPSDCLIIIDDQFEACSNSKSFNMMLSFGRRKLNCNFFIVTQNYFLNNSLSLRRNTNYTYVMNSFDKTLLSSMSRTLLNNSATINDAFQILEKQNLPYYDQWLLIDHHNASPFPMTLRIRGPNYFTKKYPQFFVQKCMYD